uniref:SHR-BD domain-containing protein n=1 Tax=Macrostomum lignano TaxID=282301 RepID=A0A1I8FHB8_9PLAT
GQQKLRQHSGSRRRSQQAIRLASGRVCLKFLAPLAGRFELRVGVQRGPDWLTEPLRSLRGFTARPGHRSRPIFRPRQLAEFGLTEEGRARGSSADGAETIRRSPTLLLRHIRGDVDSPEPTPATPQAACSTVAWVGARWPRPPLSISSPRSGWFAVTIWRDAARLRRGLCELLLVADTAASGAHLGLPGCDSLLAGAANA